MKYAMFIQLFFITVPRLNLKVCGRLTNSENMANGTCVHLPRLSCMVLYSGHTCSNWQWEWYNNEMKLDEGAHRQMNCNQTSTLFLRDHDYQDIEKFRSPLVIWDIHGALTISAMVRHHSKSVGHH